MVSLNRQAGRPSCAQHKTPLPPFGKRLRESLSSGWRPANGTILIAAGAYAWDWARCWDVETFRRAFLCLPPNDDPVSFDWSIVKGFEVVIFVFGQIADDVPERLAVLLLQAGATLTLVCYDDAAIVPPSSIVSYRPVQAGRAAA